MDKSMIKTFAVESRRQLIESIKYQASLIGITSDNITEPISKAEGMETYDYGAGTYTIFDEDIHKRGSLVNEVKNRGFDNVVEEVAYTWFNRIIAIRFMEINDYLPTRTRVLSSEIEGKIEPDIVTDALYLDLNYTIEDREKILKFKENNELDQLFKLVFIKQCNKLNEILPGLFKTTNDYFDLLLNISFTNENGIIRQLIDVIPEEDFTNQVEIIGWLYQYYISEKKDQVITLNKGNIKKDDIPAATQLFTTDWVVKYMVDNSLGRYWIERNSNSNLRSFLEYYLDEPEQDEETKNKLDKIRSEQINVNDLTFFDPCMGSGHILVYAFEVFFEIYRELGYSERDIPELILKNNIFGLDIDDRAYQLAYFAILMKARKYDRRILEKGVVPKVYAIQESGNITDEIISFIRNHDELIVEDIIYLKEVFESGKEFGSLIKLKKINYNSLRESLNDIIVKSKSKLTDINITHIIESDLMDLVNQAELLSNKFDTVVTNPPYMNKFEKSLKDFSRKYYKDYSRDLFSMFIYRNFDFCKDNGYCGFLTPFSWMFLKNYEPLRNFIVSEKSISSLIQLEYNAFTEVAMVPVGTFILYNSIDTEIDYNGMYIRLSEFKGNMDVQKNKVLDAINMPVPYKFSSKTRNYNNIPGKQIAYWLKNFRIFEFPPLKNYASVKEGVKTADNKYFIRYWFEVDINKTNIFKQYSNNIKWVKHTKGGYYRKWYGNNEYLLNYENNGFELKSFPKASITSEENFFKRNITWNRISSTLTSFRFTEEGFIPNMAGLSLYGENEFYLLGFLNSDITAYILDIMNPTLNFPPGVIAKIPLKISEEYKSAVENITKINIELCRKDWDDYEHSWDFKKHPLLSFSTNVISKNYKEWENEKNKQIQQLIENEQKLNEIFSKIYDLKININLKENELSIKPLNYEHTIKSFISYAVGCMFGRYSLDQEGIQFAGGEFNINNYHKVCPDDDNIIPILDTEYFDDDIVNRFVDFVKVCFGEENLEENLDFIAGALNKKGNTSREIIRNYFLTDFFKYHVQMYKKCPIYWQFDSGKQNAFKCLIYMHRYESDLVARVRTDYLHKTQKAIEQNLAHCDTIIANSSNKSEISKATKDKTKYIKQLDEIKTYDEALSHIANQHIEIDLDEGVKVNYDKFQKVEISKEGEKTKKINLLKKI